MRPFVRHDIGSWLVEDEEGNHAVAMIKDVDAFFDDLEDLRNKSRIKGWRDGLLQLLGNLEYALVTVQKNGTVKWQGNRFVD